MSCQPQSPAVSLSQEEETLLSLLAAEDQAIREEGNEPRLLASIQQGDYLLGAAAYSHRLGDTLLIGVMDRKTGELTAPVYQQGTYYGTPYVTTFQQNGENCLLYTHNGMHQGLSEGSSGLIRLEGDDFTWTWPVEGDLRDESSQAFADYKNYWEDHLALLAPGGESIYTMYDDDGVTNDYRKGVFRKTIIVMSGTTNLVEVGMISEGSYADVVERVTVEMIRKDRSPFWVELGDTPLEHFLNRRKFEAAASGWYYSQAKRAVLIKYPNPRRDLVLTVSFKDFDLIGM